MTVTKQFLIAKNSIPPSCFKVGGMVRASVRLQGVTHIDMTITAIEDAGVANPNSDLVSFQFDDSNLPIAGNLLDPCHIISFCCLVGCCAPWCEEVFGPGESLTTGLRHVGYLDHPMVVSYVFISVPELGDGPIQLQVLVNGVNLFTGPATVSGHTARIHRASFSSTFADGQLPADARIDVNIINTGAIPVGGGYYGYGTPAQGIRLCLDGDSY